MPPFVKTPGGSIIRDGKDVVHLSDDDFEVLVRDNSRCVVCAHKIGKASKEHVIPNWVIRKHNLSQEDMMLPQGKAHKFGTYKVPFCKNCNASLGAKIEDPIAAAFADGFDAVLELVNNGDARLFAWMNLMYFKTHFKDMTIRKNLRFDEKNETIGDEIDWPHFVASYSIFRSFLYDMSIKKSAIGSMFAFRVSDHGQFDPLHYFDVLDWSFSYFKDGDIALICGIKDMGAGEYIFQNVPEKLGRELSQFQIFEFLAECESVARRLSGHWRLEHEMDLLDGTIIIEGVVVKPMILRRTDPDLIWDGHRFVVEVASGGSSADMEPIQPLLDEIASGKLSFFDDGPIQPLEALTLPDDWQLKRWEGRFAEADIKIV